MYLFKNMTNYKKILIIQMGYSIYPSQKIYPKVDTQKRMSD